MLTYILILVFPNAFDGINNNDGDVSGGWEQGQAAPFHSLETGDGAWPHSSFHNFGIDNGPEPMNDEEVVDDAGNGLYWFWDSIWSETLVRKYSWDSRIQAKFLNVQDQ